MDDSTVRELIYFLKRRIQKNHRAYHLLYEMLTLNGAKLEQIWNRKKYLSNFGGCWVDRKDYAELLPRLTAGCSAETIELVEKWYRDGYVVLKGAVSPERIDAYRAEMAKLETKSDSPLLVTGQYLTEPKPIHATDIDAEGSFRVVDDFMFSPLARSILFNARTAEFLRLIFQSEPVLTQSLRFKYGSAQGVHQDTAFVRMTSPFKLAASWVALEDIAEGTGELVYYPGSHRWTDFLFSEMYSHYDEERDGPVEFDRWLTWLHNRMKNSAVPPERFLAKKGDVLLWHAGLAHGGTPISDKSKTRLSLVGHYCPRNARPLYHFYKPQHRKIYRDGEKLYTSSYY